MWLFTIVFTYLKEYDIPRAELQQIWKKCDNWALFDKLSESFWYRSKIACKKFYKKVVRLKYLDSASFLLVRDFLCERFILFSLILYIFKNTEAVVLGFYPLKYSNSTFHQRKHENKKVHKIMSTRNILGLLVLWNGSQILRGPMTNVVFNSDMVWHKT